MATLQRNLKLKPNWLSDAIKNKHRLTSIVCTIGPKTKEVEMLVKLLEAGMDVMRLNFSHGSHEVHPIIGRFNTVIVPRGMYQEFERGSGALSIQEVCYHVGHKGAGNKNWKTEGQDSQVGARTGLGGAAGSYKCRKSMSSQI